MNSPTSTIAEIMCSNCKGTGTGPRGYEICPVCGGTGFIRDYIDAFEALPAGWKIDFRDDCHPTGYRWAESPEGKRALVKTGLGNLKTSKRVEK